MNKKKRSCRAPFSLAAGVVVVVGWVVIKLRICEGSNEASKVVAAEVKRCNADMVMAAVVVVTCLKAIIESTSSTQAQPPMKR